MATKPQHYHWEKKLSFLLSGWQQFAGILLLSQWLCRKSATWFMSRRMRRDFLPVNIFIGIPSGSLSGGKKATPVQWALLGDVYMRNLAPARVSYRDDFFLFRVALTLWLGHFISRYLKVHFMLIKYTQDLKSQTLRIRYPFQSTGRLRFHTETVWSFRVYMIPLWDFVQEWNSRPGTTTGVYSPRGELTWGDSRRHDILWWYHVDKCRAMRGNRSELISARKSPRCHVNTLLAYRSARP